MKTKQIEGLPAEVKTLVQAKVSQPPATLGQAIGELVDEALSFGWMHDAEHDAFVKGEERVMVKVVWRAYVEELG